MRKVLCTGGSGFIGQHLIRALEQTGRYVIKNLDIAPPDTPGQRQYWSQLDILDRGNFKNAITKFGPTDIVHLAARTDMNGQSAADYAVNIDGTANLLAAASGEPQLERVIVTSTQHVRKPGSPDSADQYEYHPYGEYGRSKARTEELTRSADLGAVWTIVRPTTIWGPGHQGLADGFWRTLRNGLYVHPKPDHVVRSYGYVKNVASQYLSLLQSPPEQVNRKMFYLGDASDSQSRWVDAFAIALTGRPARRVPKQMLWMIALGGEAVSVLGLPAPLVMSRYANLTISNPVDMNPTLALTGSGPFTLAEGVTETVQWLRDDRWVDRRG